MKNTIKHLLQNLALSLASILIVLAIFEGYLRISGYYPAVPVPPGLYANHPKTWWTLRPNFSGTMDSSDGKVTYTINSQGIRAPYDFSYNSDTTKLQRIFILGDSFTFGIGIDEEYTYPRILQQNLSDQGYQVEVVNLGVAGFGTMQSYERLIEYADLLGVPDIVIYMFCPNDPVDNISGKKEVVNGIRIDSHRKHKFFLSLIGHVYYRSRVLALFLDYLYDLRFNPRYKTRQELEKKSPNGNSSNDINSSQKSNLRNRQDFQSTTDTLAKLIDWTQKNKVHFFVITTSHSQYSPPLQEFLNSQGIVMLETREVFSRLNTDNSSLSLKEGHWNKKGHTLLLLLKV